MSDQKVSPETRDRIVDLRRRGESWVAIGLDGQVRLDRRTVKKVYEEWDRDQAAKDTREARLQLKRELMATHISDLVAFANSLVSALAVPTLDDACSGHEALESFLRSYVPMRDSQTPHVLQADERRLLERRNERLYKDLEMHTASIGVADIVGKYEVARDAWLDAKVELEERAEKLLTDRLRSEGEIGSALAARRGVVRRLAQGLSLAFADAVLRSGDPDPIMASFKQLGIRDSDVIRSAIRCYLRNDRIYVEFLVGSRTVTIEGADDGMYMTLGKVLDDTTQAVVGGPGAVDVEARLDHALASMMDCNYELQVVFDNMTLRSLILDTRCDHCPV